MNEEWRDVVGYEGLYQVSNLGNVRSLINSHSNPRTNVVKVKAILLVVITGSMFK